MNFPRLVACSLALALAACDPALDADVAADPPGPPATLANDPVRITLPIGGVNLRTDSSEVVSVTRGDFALVDLLRFDGLSRFSLLSNRKVDVGNYRSVELLLDAEGAEVETLGGGAPLPIDLSTTARLAPVTFSIKDEDRESLTVTLDLRLSLALRANNRYLLDPVLRAVRNQGAAEISGTVRSALLTDPGCARGAAVYLFAGASITPDERDGADAEPLATTPVTRTSNADAGNYILALLPAGSYTLALTCGGDREDGIDAASEPIEFVGADNIELDEGETADFDF